MGVPREYHTVQELLQEFSMDTEEAHGITH